MLTFSAVFLVIVSLVIPIIILSVYCYQTDKGWKAVLYGCLDLIIVQVIGRMILPICFGQAAWFQDLLANTALYYFLYSLLCSILEIAMLYITERFWLKGADTDKDALMLGFSYGVMEGALFSGFTALSMLLSTFDQAAGRPEDYFLISVEVACMWILHAGYAFFVRQAIIQKKWTYLLAAFGIFLAVLYLGSAVLGIVIQSRLLLELLLVILAAAMVWKIRTMLKTDQKAKSSPRRK